MPQNALAWARRAARSEPRAQGFVRWLPLVLTFLICAWILVQFGVPILAVLKYALYLVVTAAVPGTLVWRLVGIGALTRLEEWAAGTTLGLAVHTLLTLTLSHLGASRMAPLWAVGVVAFTVVYPPARRAWTSRAGRTPKAMSWTLAAVVGLAAWWVANEGFRSNRIAQLPVSGEYFTTNPYPDFPFHQALAGAVLHGQAAGYPYLPDVPLRYQLLVYEHFADVTRWTGIDLTLVVTRLYALPLLGLAIVLAAAVAHRVSRSAAAGALGGVLAYLAAAPSLFDRVKGPFGQVAGLNPGTLRSPTQTFGEPFFLLLLLLGVIALSEEQLRARLVVLVAIMALAASASKATFGPMLIAALFGVVVIGLLVRAWRGVSRAALIGGAVVVAWMISLLWVVGTNSRDLQITDDLQLVGSTPGAIGFGNLHDPVGAVTGVVMVVGAWVLGVVGAVAALLLRRRDLSVWLLAGVGLAGAGAGLLGHHPGLSQNYFVRGAWPVLGALAAVGVVELGRVARASGRTWVLAAVLAASGLGFSLVLGRAFVLPARFTGPATATQLALPYLVLAAGALLAGVVASLVRRRAGGHGSPSRRERVAAVALLVVAILQGASLSDFVRFGITTQRVTSVAPDLPRDGVIAARWLRDNSPSDALVATDMHCRREVRWDEGKCDARQFWLSAYAERNILIEGWADATPSPEVAPGLTGKWSDPYWDKSFLRANDAAFRSPDPTTLGWVAAHGATWLFVDANLGADLGRLDDFADLEFRRGAFSVYRLRS